MCLQWRQPLLEVILNNILQKKTFKGEAVVPGLNPYLCLFPIKDSLHYISLNWAYLSYL